jgi:hypothetical protein
MLRTIEELRALDAPTRQALVHHAMQLSTLWYQWKLQHDGAFTITVKHETSRERKTGVHASELHGCLRKLVYAVRGEPRQSGNRDVNMQRRFDIGTMTHELIQHEFKEMCAWLRQYGTELYFDAEVPIHPGLGGVAQGYHMYSSCDGVFTFCTQGAPYLRVGLEIKTSSYLEFDKLTKPKEDHAWQTCMYQRALDLPYMWVLYYNKSNSNTTPSEAPWLFQFNEPLWSGTIEPRIMSAYQMASAGQLPAREEGRPCGWCAWAWTCNPNCMRNKEAQGGSAAREF